jgi:HAMP domain-containing protein
MKREQLKQVNAMLDSFVPTLTISLWDLHIDEARSEVASIKNYPHIAFVSLKAKELEPIEVGELIEAPSDFSIERDLIWNDEILLGSLEVIIDEVQFTNEFRREFLTQIISINAVVITTALVVYFFFKKLISRRLTKLANALRNVSADNMFNEEQLQIELPKAGKKLDEIDEVSTALHSLWHIRQALFSDLAESEKRWRLAIDSTSDGLWDWHIPSGSVLYSKKLESHVRVSLR